MNKRSLNQRTRPAYGKGHYRGVHWHKPSGKWRVSLKVEGKDKHRGYFKDEEAGRIEINKAYAEYFPNTPELHQKPYNEQLKEANDLICRKW